MTPEEAIGELYVYTLSLRDAAFIHQYAVDAHTAQTATASTKPIAVAFALIGLYLCLERGHTGREVQLAHMRLTKLRRHWPTLPLPAERGDISVHDVLKAAPGEERDKMIRAWCASVWRSWADAQPAVRELYAQAHETVTR